MRLNIDRFKNNFNSSELKEQQIKKAIKGSVDEKQKIWEEFQDDREVNREYLALTQYFPDVLTHAANAIKISGSSVQAKTNKDAINQLRAIKEIVAPEDYIPLVYCISPGDISNIIKTTSHKQNLDTVFESLGYNPTQNAIDFRDRDTRLLFFKTTESIERLSRLQNLVRSIEKPNSPHSLVSSKMKYKDRALKESEAQNRLINAKSIKIKGEISRIKYNLNELVQELNQKLDEDTDLDLFSAFPDLPKTYQIVYNLGYISPSDYLLEISQKVKNLAILMSKTRIGIQKKDFYQFDNDSKGIGLQDPKLFFKTLKKIIVEEINNPSGNVDTQTLFDSALEIIKITKVYSDHVKASRLIEIDENENDRLMEKNLKLKDKILGVYKSLAEKKPDKTAWRKEAEENSKKLMELIDEYDNLMDDFETKLDSGIPINTENANFINNKIRAAKKALGESDLANNLTTQVYKKRTRINEKWGKLIADKVIDQLGSLKIENITFSPPKISVYLRNALLMLSDDPDILAEILNLVQTGDKNLVAKIRNINNANFKETFGTEIDNKIREKIKSQLEQVKKFATVLCLGISLVVAAFSLGSVMGSLSSPGKNSASKNNFLNNIPSSTIVTTEVSSNYEQIFQPKDKDTFKSPTLFTDLRTIRSNDQGEIYDAPTLSYPSDNHKISKTTPQNELKPNEIKIVATSSKSQVPMATKAEVITTSNSIEMSKSGSGTTIKAQANIENASTITDIEYQTSQLNQNEYPTDLPINYDELKASIVSKNTIENRPKLREFFSTLNPNSEFAKKLKLLIYDYRLNKSKSDFAKNLRNLIKSETYDFNSVKTDFTNVEKSATEIAQQIEKGGIICNQASILAAYILKLNGINVGLVELKNLIKDDKTGKLVGTDTTGHMILVVAGDEQTNGRIEFLTLDPTPTQGPGAAKLDNLNKNRQPIKSESSIPYGWILIGIFSLGGVSFSCYRTKVNQQQISVKNQTTELGQNIDSEITSFVTEPIAIEKNNINNEEILKFDFQTYLKNVLMVCYSNEVLKEKLNKFIFYSHEREESNLRELSETIFQDIFEDQVGLLSKVGFNNLSYIDPNQPENKGNQIDANLKFISNGIIDHFTRINGNIIKRVVNKSTKIERKSLEPAKFTKTTISDQELLEFKQQLETLFKYMLENQIKPDKVYKIKYFRKVFNMN